MAYEAKATIRSPLMLTFTSESTEIRHDEAIGFTAWSQRIQSYVAGDVILFEGVDVNEGKI